MASLPSYKPSKKLASLTSPDLDPYDFGALWLWHHHLHANTSGIKVHTIVCGAARPSDLDDGVKASFLAGDSDVQAKIERVDERLTTAFDDAHGPGWRETWWKNLPTCYQTTTGVNFTQNVWCYNVMLAWGMADFARARYGAGVGNRKKWEEGKSYEENLEKGQWGYMPGLSIVEGEGYEKELEVCAEGGRVVEAMRFMHRVFMSERRREEMQKGEEGEEKDDFGDVVIEEDWKAAYDLRPWAAFPER